MSDLRPGDVVFSYVGRNLIAVSVVRSQPFQSSRPAEFKAEELWEREGQRVDVQYTDIGPPLSIPSVISQLAPLMPPRYGPLDRNGDGNQGYLFRLPPQAARLLLDGIGTQAPASQDDLIARGITNAPIDETEKRALILSRVGQGRFRDSLMERWHARCCVTGLAIARLLRASHIKPWRDSNNAERLDPSNGLLLAPSYDAAFDEGFVTFEPDGRIRISPQLDPADMERLGLDPAAKINGLEDGHRPYLGYHADVLFRR
jgi:hypothetical protein